MFNSKRRPPSMPSQENFEHVHIFRGRRRVMSTPSLQREISIRDYPFADCSRVCVYSRVHSESLCPIWISLLFGLLFAWFFLLFAIFSGPSASILGSPQS